MKCPNCDQLLLIAERQNVEIDYCPSCRGVWLDKGELDKLIQFSNQQEVPTPDFSQKDFKSASEKYEAYQKQQQGYGKYPKKKSFLGDLFDFD